MEKNGTYTAELAFPWKALLSILTLVTPEKLSSCRLSLMLMGSESNLNLHSGNFMALALRFTKAEYW